MLCFYQATWCKLLSKVQAVDGVGRNFNSGRCLLLFGSRGIEGKLSQELVLEKGRVLLVVSKPRWTENLMFCIRNKIYCSTTWTFGSENLAMQQVNKQVQISGPRYRIIIQVVYAYKIQITEVLFHDFSFFYKKTFKNSHGSPQIINEFLFLICL